jgi:hypothetical protein
MSDQVQADAGSGGVALAGWIYAAAWMFGVAVNSAIASNSLVAVFALHHENVSWLAFFVPMIVICAGINYIARDPAPGHGLGPRAPDVRRRRPAQLP